MKNKIKTKEDLRNTIYNLGYTLSSFSRVLQLFGDTRNEAVILRNLQRTLKGETTLSNELVVILNLLNILSEQNQLPKDPRQNQP